MCLGLGYAMTQHKALICDQVEQYGIAYLVCSLPTRAALLVAYFNEMETKEHK